MDLDGAGVLQAPIPHEINRRAGYRTGLCEGLKTSRIRQTSTKNLRQISPQATHLTDPELARAISAGTHPAEHVHPVVLDVMREVGIGLSHAKPQKLTIELAQGAEMLITMGCGDECPYVPGLKRDDWPLPDPKGQGIESVREIRDDIRQRVLKLIEKENLAQSTVFS